MKEESPQARAELLLQLSNEVSRIAGSLAQLSSAGGPPLPPHPCPNMDMPEDLLERVRWVIAARRKRSRYLTAELFAEPAWDMLLDLFRAELAQQRICVSSACIAAGVPATTGLRWLKILEQQGLVLRECDERDARRTFVALSPETSAALRRYFAEVVTARAGETDSAG